MNNSTYASLPLSDFFYFCPNYLRAQMFKYLKYNRQLTNVIGLWFVAGYLFSASLYVLVPATLFILGGKFKYLIIFLGFWFVLILSDARGGFESASIVKILYVLLLVYFASQKGILNLNRSYQYFIPFIAISVISLTFSPIIFDAAQKTLSYFLLLLVVPSFVSFLLRTNKNMFLLGLVYTGALVLLLGLVMRVIQPEFAIYAERYSGVFGNPNGVGIFSLLYNMLWGIIKHHHPHLFSRKDRIVVNALIIISVLLCASRGALLSVTMFYALDYSVRKKNPFVAAGVVVVFLSFFFMENIIGWLYQIGLGEYLRAQTLENGSGRIVAYEFAWEQIKLNPIFGMGFGYSEYWFHKEEVEIVLNLLNHQGNTHNSYLTILMDTGFMGGIAFLVAWGTMFSKSIKQSPFGVPVLIIVLFSSNVEAWLAASLNPFTIIIVTILALLSDQAFTKK